MPRELRTLRQALIVDIRAYDDETMRRTEQWLARPRRLLAQPVPGLALGEDDEDSWLYG
jgi:hypothetical protein